MGRSLEHITNSIKQHITFKLNTQIPRRSFVKAALHSACGMFSASNIAYRTTFEILHEAGHEKEGEITKERDGRAQVSPFFKVLYK